MFRLSTFKHVKDNVPVVTNHEDLITYFTYSQAVKSKKEASEHISFSIFKTGTKRKKENVEKVLGLLLDFDFQEDVTGSINGKNYIEELLLEHNINQFYHIWHTTFRYTDKRPRFRLILPLKPGTSFSPSEALEVYDSLFYLFKDAKYLDAAPKDLSHMFSCPCHKFGEKYYFGSDKYKPFITKHSLIKRPVEPYNKKKHYNNIYPDAQNKILDALRYLPSDIEYFEWIKVGMALKHEFGNNGFFVWDDWSKKSSKYSLNDKNQMLRHWESFKSSGVSGASIVRLAQERGGYPKSSKSHKASPNIVSETIRNIETIQETSIGSQGHFSQWGKFSYDNIYDLSAFPFLNWLNKIYYNLCDSNRHEMRLASVITVAGHLIGKAYNSPVKTNFYTMSFMPTGTGKDRFLQTTSAIIDSFNCRSHLCADIGSYQGLFTHLKANNCTGFCLIDEIAETFKMLQRSGNQHFDLVKKALKIVAVGDSLPSSLVKSENIEMLDNIFMSLFWAGTENAFKFVSEDDFRGGLLGRFLFFLLTDEDKKYTGIRGGEEEHRKADTPINYQTIEQFMPPDIEFFFGESIKFPTSFFAWFEEFADFLDKKESKVGGSEDIRATLMARTAHNMKKLAMITCDKNGVVSEQGVKWATGVAIHSLRNGSYLTQKHFNVSLSTRDLREITSKILTLRDQSKNSKINKRLLLRALQKISTPRINAALDRLIEEEKIAISTERKESGQLSTYIYVFPTLQPVKNTLER